MPTATQQTNSLGMFSVLGRNECHVSVPMAGIPQISNELLQWFKDHYDDEPPTRLQAEYEETAREFMAEHRRRREAKKMGVDLSQYFGAGEPKSRFDDEDED